MSTLELASTHVPTESDSNEQRRFFIEVDRILYYTNERVDLSLKDRWELALREVKRRKLKGLTPYFRNTVPEPATDLNTTITKSPVTVLTDLFSELETGDAVEEPRPQNITHSSPIPDLKPEIQTEDLYESPITKLKQANTFGDHNTMAEGGGTIESTLAELTKSMQRLDVRLQCIDSKLEGHSNSLSDAFKQISKVRTYVDDRIHEGMRDPFANPGLRMPFNMNTFERNAGRNYNNDHFSKPTTMASEDEEGDLKRDQVRNRHRSGSNGFYDLRRDQRMLAQGKSKLRSFTREGENFAAFENRFRAMWRSNGWSEEEALAELINNLDGPAQRIVQSRHDAMWTVESLIASCNKRLRAKYSITQVQAELDQLQSKVSDTPESIMRKVEDVIFKCPVTEDNQMTLMILQRQAFVRLLYLHMPMYYHVCENSQNMADPYSALDAAEEYLRTKGHSNVYLTQMMRENLTQWGFKFDENHPNTNADPRYNSPSAPNTNQYTPPMHSGIAELTTKIDRISQHLAAQDEVKVDARFQSAKNKPDDWWEQMVRTTNDHERSIRTLCEKVDTVLEKVDPQCLEKFENRKRERAERFRNKIENTNKPKYGDKPKYNDKDDKKKKKRKKTEEEEMEEHKNWERKVQKARGNRTDNGGVRINIFPTNPKQRSRTSSDSSSAEDEEQEDPGFQTQSE